MIILASVGNGWRKDVTDQCLEFVIILASVGNGWRKDVTDQCLEFVIILASVNIKLLSTVWCSHHRTHTKGLKVGRAIEIK